ncbi:sugar ABC transporter substrate-binding protein [Clostridium saccharobutylicum]|uniref:D-ribose-binding periplasmic protein n=1 Tax=Clostridium saccharobutylicum TaxID=169679 RepID=A0A1S8NHM7_CLOSA|nr:sugar ABC transporter substrate-binding protein [Clostridium saccharobutylicum]OOM15979.1 D-ribose-binding periplasmic protein precursor [Clostridium saccharobutylicum]
MKRKIIALLSTVFIVGSLVGCGSKTQSQGTTSGNEKKVIYFIPIVDTGAYWSPMKKAAEDEAKALGYELVVKTSPPNETQKNEKHIGFLDEAVKNKAAGIAIAPMDPDMFDKKVKKANEKGIPVVTFDADIKTKENRTAYIGTDNKLAGEQLGENGAKTLKEKGITKGKIGMAAVNLTQTTMTYREDGVKAGFEKKLWEMMLRTSNG